jgi:23S rRNA pseudouridine2605 synthase
VLGHLGLVVTRLIRVSFGPFQLGELAAGDIEEVRTRVLREQIGARMVALSGADFSSPVAAPPPPEKKEPTRASDRARPASNRSTSHSWRAREEEHPRKKLKRKFHGAHRDDEKPREPSTGERRAALLTDRKGRRVLVERFGQAPADPAPAGKTRNPRHRSSAPRGRRRRSR